ncbi:hypothetical protein SAMN05216412_104143 [Nitrosospira multiformis]|uniref:Formylmethanofuran dehydrogenase subunit E domain-containing protein n=1 Tax=Nitrosospira multiformis TaxID=1231 RepID=A0A1I0CYS5_9PROT|nr:hypothetical protein [Nitrosospira multiformis]SET24495.1 hypothetical protein SAMN05216412_104143 [Nitrosospira multiformis]
MHFPDFYEKAPVIRTRDPFAAMLGAARDGVLEYRYVDAVRLAGHSCPTVGGAFLVGRAALAALYPDEPAERGNIAVYMPAPEHEGVTGVMAQVLTLLTGAASSNGFHGIRGQFRRQGLLTFAEQQEGEAIIFKRLDTGASVAVHLNVSPVPANPAQGERLTAILEGHANDLQRGTFAQAWQERVRRLLLEFADDPDVIRVRPV